MRQPQTRLQGRARDVTDGGPISSVHPRRESAEGSRSGHNAGGKVHNHPAGHEGARGLPVLREGLQKAKGGKAR